MEYNKVLPAAIMGKNPKRGEGMDEVKMMISCVVEKDNRKIVRVSFMRGSDYADGVLPDGMIEKSGGFSQEEVRKLENYLRTNRRDILRQGNQSSPELAGGVERVLTIIL